MDNTNGRRPTVHHKDMSLSVLVAFRTPSCAHSVRVALCLHRRVCRNFYRTESYIVLFDIVRVTCSCFRFVEVWNISGITGVCSLWEFSRRGGFAWPRGRAEGS